MASTNHCLCPPRRGAGGCCPARTAYVERQVLPVGELELSPPEDDTGFGASTAVSADGRVLVVGAPRTFQDVGHVYVYERRCFYGASRTSVTADDFVLVQTLEADAEDVDAMFGTSVAVSADGARLVVGSPRQSDAPPGSPDNDVGAVYVYDRTVGKTACATPYTLVQKVVPQMLDAEGEVVPETEFTQGFGFRVALSRNEQVLLVSNRLYDSTFIEPNAAVYWYTDCSPRRYALVCSKTVNPPFLFRQRIDTAEAAEQVEVPAANLNAIGTALALSADGTVAIVGASFATPSPPTIEEAGAVLVYRRQKVTGHACGAWALAQYIENEQIITNLDNFGAAVALTPDAQYLAVESIEFRQPDSPDTFKRFVTVYRAQCVAGQPTFVQDGPRLPALESQENEPAERRQLSLAMSDDGCIVAVGLEDTDVGSPEQNRAGQVAVYCRSRNADGQTVWTQRQQLDQGVDAQENGRFGESVSMSGDAKTLVAGVAPSGNSNYDLVYVYGSHLVPPTGH